MPFNMRFPRFMNKKFWLVYKTVETIYSKAQFKIYVLSTMELRILKPFYKFLYFNLSTPYQLSWGVLDSSNSFQAHFNLRISSFQYQAWRLITYFLLAFVYFIYLIFLLLKNSSTYISSHDYSRLIFSVMWTVSLFSLLTLQTPNYFCGSEIVLLVNGTENLIIDMERKHFRSCVAFKKSKKLRSQIMAMVSVYSIVSIPFTVPILLLFQEEPWALSGILYKLLVYCWGQGWSFAFKIIGMIVNIWWVYIMWGSCIIFFHINILFIHTFKHAIKNIVNAKFYNLTCKNAQNQIQECMLIYRKLRILCGLYNSVYGKMFVAPFKSVIAIAIVESVVVMFRIAGNDLMLVLFSISMFTISVALLFLFIEFLAMVNEYAIKLEKFLKAKFTLSKLACRMVRSFKVEAVKSGDFYLVKKLTCLTFFAFVGNLTSSFLITFKT